MTPFWDQCQEILPHVLRLQSVFQAESVLTPSESFASLLGDAAYYRWEKGLLSGALDLCYLARDILEKVADETSVHKADVLNVIGAIYIESGAAHINEGTAIMERVLQIRRNRLALRKETDHKFREDFICVSNALSNLSCCFIGLRKYDEAGTAITESIRMLERYCTADTQPYGFAERYANLSQVLAGRGKLDEGIEYARKATDLQRAGFGQMDVRSAVFESYLGNFLIKAGRIDEAYTVHKAALDLRLSQLGSGTNDVAKSLYFVAHCLYLQGKFEESE